MQETSNQHKQLLLENDSQNKFLAFTRNFGFKNRCQTRRLALRKVLLKYNNKALDVNGRNVR